MKKNMHFFKNYSFREWVRDGGEIYSLLEMEVGGQLFHSTRFRASPMVQPIFRFFVGPIKPHHLEAIHSIFTPKVQL